MSKPGPSQPAKQEKEEEVMQDFELVITKKDRKVIEEQLKTDKTPVTLHPVLQSRITDAITYLRSQKGDKKVTVDEVVERTHEEFNRNRVAQLKRRKEAEKKRKEEMRKSGIPAEDSPESDDEMCGLLKHVMKK